MALGHAVSFLPAFASAGDGQAVQNPLFPHKIEKVVEVHSGAAVAGNQPHFIAGLQAVVREGESAVFLAEVDGGAGQLRAQNLPMVGGRTLTTVANMVRECSNSSPIWP